MENKYIIVETKEDGSRAILFSHWIKHYEVGRGLDVVAAGFYQLDGDTVRAYGHSESMKIVSRPELDAPIIAELIRGAPIVYSRPA